MLELILTKEVKAALKLLATAIVGAVLENLIGIIDAIGSAPPV